MCLDSESRHNDIDYWAKISCIQSIFSLNLSSLNTLNTPDFHSQDNSEMLGRPLIEE
jgi:hypothetical protein